MATNYATDDDCNIGGAAAGGSQCVAKPARQSDIGCVFALCACERSPAGAVGIIFAAPLAEQREVM